MIQLSKRTQAKLMILTELHPLRVHWSGRSLICPTTDCPLCEFERPRAKYYCLADDAGGPDILEVQSSLYDLIGDLLFQHDKQSAAGLQMHLQRPSNKRPWKCDDSRWVQAKPAPPTLLIDLAASLFRIPDTEEMFSWQDFRLAAGNAHRHFIRESVLPFSDLVAK